MIYDKFAEKYDRSIAPFEKRFLAKWREETLSYLPENSRILEIGAGTGANFQFYPRCQNAVATDISFQMLAVAKSKSERIQIVQTSAENLPFAVNSFDAALATLVFCSIPQPEKAFAELRRVVRPNGRVIMLEHIRPPGLVGYFFDALNVLTVQLIEDHFNRRTAEIAENCGLKIERIERKAFGIVNLIICRNQK